MRKKTQIKKEKHESNISVFMLYHHEMKPCWWWKRDKNYFCLKSIFGFFLLSVLGWRYNNTSTEEYLILSFLDSNIWSNLSISINLYRWWLVVVVVDLTNRLWKNRRSYHLVMIMMFIFSPSMWLQSF